MSVTSFISRGCTLTITINSTNPMLIMSPQSSAIPGNHDGEVDDPTVQTSLAGWVAYFMQARPDVDPISKDAPRVGLNLPNVYWTLMTPFATIIGMYTNVLETGFESIRYNSSGSQMSLLLHPRTGPSSWRCHHPIFPFDVFHSGSSKLADVLKNAIQDTGRVPKPGALGSCSRRSTD